MSATTFDLIRHGEPEGGRRYRGDGIDDPLSEKGWRQMWEAVGDEAPWGLIISSPLRRCREFAEALGERADIPITIEPRLREVGFGEWEGRPPAELQHENPGILDRFYSDPIGNRPPGAEPLDAFRTRVGAAFDDLVATHPGEHLLAVVHAGVIRAVIAHVLETPPAAMYRMAVDNAGLTRIRTHEARPPTLLFHGRRHL
ncbi:MAG TPA: histidine phosphatase family protein [Chromatiales bacterium]|nr:histidine phosphatase family protein [Chromatiales bacterium]